MRVWVTTATMALNDGYAYREQIQTTSGETALGYLSEKYRHSSRPEWEARFARGEVELDRTVTGGDALLRAGQVLCWNRPPWEEADVPLSFRVAHEDQAIVAVVKPSGLPTVPSGGFLKHTLLSLVQDQWPAAIPLHRLGRATSGLVVFARTPAIAAVLFKSWREGRVDKRYRALSTGFATNDVYDITAPIGLLPHPRLGSVHGASESGKPSRSVARVLERRDQSTVFQVHLHTGRPEQIRIHLAFIGHPLLGDPLFAAGGTVRTDAPGLPGDGGYSLHAESIAFTHPATGGRLSVWAEPPLELRTTAHIAVL